MQRWLLAFSCRELMRPAVVVEANPVAHDAAGVLQRLQAVPVRTLLLQGSNDAFHHAVLLRRVRRDELLPEAVAAHQGGVAATGEDQAIVAAQEERGRDAPQCAVAGDQSLLQRRLRRLGLARTRQVPASSSGYGSRSPAPAWSTGRGLPDPTQVRRPAFIRGLRHRVSSDTQFHAIRRQLPLRTPVVWLGSGSLIAEGRFEVSESVAPSLDVEDVGLVQQASRMAA